MSSRARSAGARRHEVSKRAREVERLFPRIRRLFRDGALLTTTEVCQALPEEPIRDVRTALSVLHADGDLIRLTDPQCVVYALADGGAS